MKFIHCLKKQVWAVLLFAFALSFLSCQDLEKRYILTPTIWLFIRKNLPTFPKERIML